MHQPVIQGEKGDRPVARLIQKGRRVSQSGKAGVGGWVLQFRSCTGLRHDPLTGWQGGASTRNQVELHFPTRDAAEHYAQRNGLLLEERPLAAHHLRLRAYADNFL